MDSEQPNARQATEASKWEGQACLRGEPGDTNPTAFRLLAIPLIVAAAWVLACHWPVLSCQALSIDDSEYVTENPLVKNPGWKSAARFLCEVLEPSSVDGYYQPLPMISLMVDCALGGRADNLRSFHRTSLALHVLNTILICTLLYLLFGRPWVAALVSLLFGVHPLTVEPVAWVAERKTMLATFFALICLVLYVLYTRRATWKRYGACAAALVLALMSKPTSTPLPALMLLLDYWPLRRLGRRALLEKLPFILIASLASLVTIISQGRTSFLRTPAGRPPAEILLVLCHNIVFYLYKAAWPLKVSGNYMRPETLSLGHPMVLAGLIGTCVLILVLLITWRWTRGPLTGWLFFFVAIFPTIGVIEFTNVIAADKFAYLPLLGFLLILASGLGRAWDGATGTRTPRRIAVVAVVLLCAGLASASTRAHLVHWRDSISLHRYVVRVSPDSALAHTNLGAALFKHGQAEEAAECFRQAIRLSPRFRLPRLNLANLLAVQGEYQQALAEYSELLEVDPGHFVAWDNKATLLMQVGRYNDALYCCDQMLQIAPENAQVWTNKGWLLERLGRPAEARQCFQKAQRGRRGG